MAWTKTAPKKPGMYWVAVDIETKKRSPPNIRVYPAIVHQMEKSKDLIIECNFRQKQLDWAHLWWDTATTVQPPAPEVKPLAEAKKESVKRKFPIVVQKWEESERGWGTRPDGWTMHLTEEDRVQFIKDMYKSYPKEVPDEYTRTDGSPYLMDVDQKTYDELRKAKKEKKCGIWGPGKYPPKPGKDGWMPVSFPTP